MHAASLDFYLERQSLIHHLPPMAKLGTGLCLIILLAFAPRTSWLLLGGAGLVLLSVVAVARLPLAKVFARVLIFEPFVAGIALLSLLQPHGVVIFLGLILKSSLCLLAMVILTATTSFVDLLAALRRLHVPALMVTTLGLTYRYLFLLIDEQQRLHRARAARTYTRRRGDWHTLSSIIAQLFLRSYVRAERVYAAMSARGWKS
jgi:cobalt/nickel transport system permease protein